MRGRRSIVALLCAVAVTGCASAPPGALNDPYEHTNRDMFAFNDKFNKYVTLPIAWVYVQQLPAPIHKGLNNLFANLESPVTFANDLLQGHVERAGETLLRFTFNSTVGFAGLYDIAAREGLPRHVSDFGQTLSIYGVNSGPFLVLPVIGPTTPRDAFGGLADLALDPLLYVPPSWPLAARAGTTVGLHVVTPFEEHASSITFRNQLAGDSVDPYGTMRSVYRQQRASEIESGETPPLPNENE